LIQERERERERERVRADEEMPNHDDRRSGRKE